MTAEVRAERTFPLRWRRGPVLAVGVAGAALLAAVGLALSRPDIVAVGLPLALSSAWMLFRRPRGGSATITLRAKPGGTSSVPEARGAIDVDTDADWMQLAIEQGGRRTAVADVSARGEAATTRTVLRHSGPVELLAVTGRAVAVDGAWIADATSPVILEWHTPPRTRRLGRLPLAPRLTGLHGAHDGSRPGDGGDFRDIHPFAPGDQLRRIDWRATARAARRPGELLVRRNQSLSDSSIVIAVDTADDLGEAVASWGTGDPDRSGVTSLDLAREAAASFATAAIAAGDRVAYHSLSFEGHSVRSGSGRRHLARVLDTVAATGLAAEESRYRRSPAVPAGSLIVVLSTFFDGVAADLATRWRASGHAVLAVDTLPVPDAARLTRDQRIAMRALLAERADVLDELRHTGIEVVSWSSPDVDAELRVAALRQQRMRSVRR